VIDLQSLSMVEKVGYQMSAGTLNRHSTGGSKEPAMTSLLFRVVSTRGLSESLIVGGGASAGA
jgi:hypothetical protein